MLTGPVSLSLFAEPRVEGRDTMSFQNEQGAAYDRQKVQMGLHFRGGNVLYVSVLIMIEADLKTNRPPQF